MRGRGIASFRGVAAGNSHRPARAEDVRHLLCARLPGLRPHNQPPPARARPPGRLDVRVRLRRTDWGPRRLARGLPDPELGHGLRRRARQRLLGGRPGLVRRLRWRGARSDPVGTLAALARMGAVRHRGGTAGCGLRDRPGGLPALRRWGLRHQIGPALGDGVSRRNGADHRRGASHARVRDACDGGRRAGPVAGCATAWRPGSCSGSTW